MKDRYRAKLLEKSEVLTQACEWVHTFPVCSYTAPLTPAAQRKMLNQYAFSSYLAAVNGEASPSDPSLEFLRGYGSPVKKRAEKHREACEALLSNGTKAWEKNIKRSPVAIGSESFVKEMEQKHAALVAGKRIKGVRIYGKKVQGIARMKVVEETAKVFGVKKEDFFIQRHNSVLRPVLSAFLYQYANMTQKEIAAFLKLGSAAAVSLQIKRYLLLRQQDPEVEKKCRKLEKSFARS